MTNIKLSKQWEIFRLTDTILKCWQWIKFIFVAAVFLFIRNSIHFMFKTLIMANHWCRQLALRCLVPISVGDNDYFMHQVFKVLNGRV